MVLNDQAVMFLMEDISGLAMAPPWPGHVLPWSQEKKQRVSSQAALEHIFAKGLKWVPWQKYVEERLAMTPVAFLLDP